MLSLENLNKLNTKRMKVIKVDKIHKGIGNKEKYIINLKEKNKLFNTKHKLIISDSLIENDLLKIETYTENKTKELELFTEKLIQELKNEPKNRIRFLLNEKKIEMSHTKNELKKVMKISIEMIVYTISIFLLILFTIDSFFVITGMFGISGLLFVLSQLNYIDPFDSFEDSEEMNNKIRFLLKRIVLLIYSFTLSCLCMTIVISIINF